MIYRPSPLFRFLPVFGSLAFLAFAALGVVVAVVEDAAMGWWAGRRRHPHAPEPVFGAFVMDSGLR